jgi:hypothetical protein
MNNLDNRIQRLEDRLKGQDKMSRANVATEDVIRKLALDPDKLRATARENNQSMAEVMASELNMPSRNLKEALKLRTHGK